MVATPQVHQLNVRPTIISLKRRQHKKRKRVFSRIVTEKKLNENMRTMTRDKTVLTLRDSGRHTYGSARHHRETVNHLDDQADRQAGLRQRETQQETLDRQDTDTQAHVALRQCETPQGDSRPTCRTGGQTGRTTAARDTAGDRGTT